MNRMPSPTCWAGWGSIIVITVAEKYVSTSWWLARLAFLTVCSTNAFELTWRLSSQANLLRTRPSTNRQFLSTHLLPFILVLATPLNPSDGRTPINSLPFAHIVLSIECFVTARSRITRATPLEYHHAYVYILIYHFKYVRILILR